MFFTLSKILWPLIKPATLVFLLLTVGAILSFVWKKTGRTLLGLGLILFIVLGVFQTGPHFLYNLEHRYERPDPMSAHLDGIIVLGGIFDVTLAGAEGQPMLGETADRIIDGLALAAEHPEATLVFSGGTGKLRGGRPETEDVKTFLEHVHYPPRDNIVYENQSRNTYENALFTYNKIKPEEGERWLLVTSAFHMPRAMAVFKSQGWKDTIIAYPTDYRIAGQTAPPPYSANLNILGNLYSAETVLHERLGRIVYKLSGKITSP